MVVVVGLGVAGVDGSELAGVPAMVERARGRGGGECGPVRVIQTALAGLSAAPRKLAGRRWHGRVCAHGEHTLGALWRGGDDDWQRQSAGPVQMGRQVSGPGDSLLSLCLLF